MSNKTVQMRRLTPTGVHIREKSEAEEQSRSIAGYAILFNTPSAVMWSDEREEAREVIAPEAITRDLLDKSDIKMTMFHDRQLILARSNKGKGTLTYNVDEKGVYFEFEAPATVDGDKALELVRRGDLAGCSFAFTTYYYDRDYVSREVSQEGEKKVITYTVRNITGVYDFTLAADPAYPDTTVRTNQREIISELRKSDADEAQRIREHIEQMRRVASMKI